MRIPSPKSVDGKLNKFPDHKHLMAAAGSDAGVGTEMWSAELTDSIQEWKEKPQATAGVSEKQPLDSKELLELMKLCKDAYGEEGPKGWERIKIAKAFVKLEVKTLRICIGGTHWDAFKKGMEQIMMAAKKGKDGDSTETGEGMGDVGILARMKLVEVHGGGKAHKGFLSVANALVDPLVERIKSGTVTCVELLGHDSGGSIATLLSVLLRSKIDPGIKVRLVTFGALAVGDKGLMERVKTSTAEIKRCITGLDPVPNFLITLQAGGWVYVHPATAHNITPWSTIFKETVNAVDFLESFDEKISTAAKDVEGCWEKWHSADAYVKHLTAAVNPGIQFMDAAVSGAKVINGLAKSDVGRTAIKGVTGVLHSVNPSHIMAVTANCAVSPILGVALETTNMALNAYQCYQLSKVISLVDNLPGQFKDQIKLAEGNIIGAIRSDLKKATEEITESVIEAIKERDREDLYDDIRAEAEKMADDMESMYKKEGVPVVRSHRDGVYLRKYRIKLMRFLSNDVDRCDWDAVRFDILHLAMVASVSLQLLSLHRQWSIYRNVIDNLYTDLTPLLGKALYRALDDDNNASKVGELRRRCAWFTTIFGIPEEQEWSGAQLVSAQPFSSSSLEVCLDSGELMSVMVNIIYDAECRIGGEQQDGEKVTALYRAVFADSHRAYEARIDLSLIVSSNREEGVRRVLRTLREVIEQMKGTKRLLSCVVHILKAFIQILKEDNRFAIVMLEGSVLQKSISACVDYAFTQGADEGIRMSLRHFLNLAIVGEEKVVEKLIEVMPQHRSISSLELTDMNIGWKGALVISGVLPQCEHLQTLDLANNSIGNKGAVALAGALPQCKQLQTLYLGNNSIRDEGATALAATLPRCLQLHTLELELNSIGAEGAAALGGALPKCLQILHLNNCIGAEGAVALAGALRQCQLQTLNLAYNSIGEQGAVALAGALPQCQQLQILNLRNNRISHKGMVALAGALQRCQQLQTLYFGDNIIGKKGVKALAEALWHCQQLRILDLERNYIGEQGAVALVGALQQCQQLHTLYLSKTGIGVQGATALAGTLLRCQKLQALGLGSNSIGEEGAKALAKTLPKCQQLQALGLGSNSIGEEGATLLAGTLRQCQKLQTLDLEWNSIGDKGAAALAIAFSQWEHLQTLYLGNNSIGAEGAAALAGALPLCQQLQTLDLGNNSIGAEGAVALAKAFWQCQKLQTLNLGGNSIGANGAVALAKAFWQGQELCQKLQILNLGSNSIGAKGATVLAGALPLCQQLQTLYLANNSIGDEGAKALAKTLSQCQQLQTLYLGNNIIGDEGAKALAKTLSQCQQLQTLYLGNNIIGDEGAKALAKTLPQCQQLQTLYFRNNSIGYGGAKALAGALSKCQQRPLHLSIFGITASMQRVRSRWTGSRVKFYRWDTKYN